jgi:hypothetical protein
LAALVTSLASVGSVYADALEAESSALPILTADADTNGVDSLNKMHCVLYSDGADNCIVNVQLEAVDQWSTAVSEINPSETELAPTVKSVDAIRVVVVQTVAIATPGVNAGDREDTANTGAMPVPATEPVVDPDAKTTTGGLFLPIGQSADAIEVAIVQSITVAVAGQIARDRKGAADAESIPDSREPASIALSENDRSRDAE